MSTGLILQGGGMRGAYTGGFLEIMLSEKIVFPYVVAVSAGALTAANYLSKQPGRNYSIFSQYVMLPEYAGISNLVKSGSLFNFDFMLNEIGEKLLPWDIKTFFENDSRFLITVTNIETGRAEFYDKSSLKGDRDLSLLRATASLPFISRPVYFDKKIFMDGGCASPIPIEQSILDGNDFHVIVMTRQKGYRKNPVSNSRMIRTVYKNYPKFVEVLLNQHNIYNKQVSLCERLENEGKALIIRPNEAPMVGKYEKDSRRLIALLAKGSIDAGKKLVEIKKSLLI